MLDLLNLSSSFSGCVRMHFDLTPEGTCRVASWPVAACRTGTPSCGQRGICMASSLPCNRADSTAEASASPVTVQAHSLSLMGGGPGLGFTRPLPCIISYCAPCPGLSSGATRPSVRATESDSKKYSMWGQPSASPFLCNNDSAAPVNNKIVPHTGHYC